MSDFEIEETNEFFQLSKLTIDDLQVYAESFAPVCNGVQLAAAGKLTEQELVQIVREAGRKYKSVDDRITVENT